jgi:hypothetical protein
MRARLPPRELGATIVHAPIGFLTNCCVESTMRTAYEKGYNVVTLTDCTATLSDDEQRLAVEKNYPMFSRPMKQETSSSEPSKAPRRWAPAEATRTKVIHWGAGGAVRPQNQAPRSFLGPFADVAQW